MAVPVQEPHVFIKDEVGLGHQAVRFRNKGLLPAVSTTKMVEFFIRNNELPTISEGGSRVVFSFHYQDLKAFPAKRLKRVDMPIHILQVVEFANYRVNLEPDTVLLAPECNFVQDLDLVSRSSSDLDVRGFVKRIAADREDVDVLAVLFKKPFLDKTTIRDDGNRFEAEVLLAEIHHVAEKLRVQERLPASKINFPHTSLLE